MGQTQEVVSGGLPSAHRLCELLAEAAWVGHAEVEPVPLDEFVFGRGVTSTA